MLDDVQTVLMRGTHFLVLDGLEAVQSTGDGNYALGELVDRRLRRLLRSLAAGSGGSRAVVTSRLPVSDLVQWEGARTIRLEPLTREESAQVLQTWGVVGSVDDALDRFEGHPLSLAMLGSLCRSFYDGRIPRDLEPQTAATDNVLARKLAGILRQYKQALHEGDAQWLALLVALPRQATVAALVKWAWAVGVRTADAPQRAQRALGRLKEMGLVFQSGSGAYSAHPFVRENFREEAIESAVSLVSEPRQVTRASELERLEAQIGQLLQAGLHDDAYAVYRLRLGGFANIGARLGRFDLGLRLVHGFSSDGIPQTLSRRLAPEGQSRLLHDWAKYADRMGDFQAGAACAQVRLSLVAGVDREEHVHTLLTMAYRHWLLDEPDDAEALQGHAYSIVRPNTPAWSVCVALGAAIFAEQGRTAHATRAFELADLASAPATARSRMWEAEFRIAHGDRVETVEDIERYIEASRKLQSRSKVAYGDLVLGHAVMAFDRERAWACLRRARRWTKKSGEVELTLRAHRLHAALARAEGRVDVAERQDRRLAQLRAGVHARRTGT